MFASAAQTLSSQGSYNFIWIIVGVVTIIGGLIEFMRWRDRRVIRNDKLDELLKRVTPNGKNTNQLGDVAARTEDAVNRLNKQFEHHRNAVNRRLRALERHAGLVK